MCMISIDIPDDVLFTTNSTQEDAETFARRMVALGYYERGDVSLGY